MTDNLKQRDATTIVFEVAGPGKVWTDDFAIPHLEPGEAPEVTEFEKPKTAGHAGRSEPDTGAD